MTFSIFFTLFSPKQCSAEVGDAHTTRALDNKPGIVFISLISANNNYEEEDLKCPTEMGDTQNTLHPQQGNEDESGDEEVWESVSELASDEGLYFGW